MVMSKELHAWSRHLKEWAALVETPDVRQHMMQLAAELGRLAECKEAAERQLV